MQDRPGTATEIRTLAALGEALDATPGQLEAIRAAADENKRRNAAILLTPPREGGPTAGHYLLGEIARGIDMDSALGQGMIAKYLGACTGPDGASLLEALGRSNQNALEAACAALTESQARLLRELFPRGLSDIDTGLDAMGEAMREAMRPSCFATWEDFVGAAGLPHTATARLLDEFVVLKEQLAAVLQTAPAEGGESPLDYQARLLAADDPDASAAFERCLVERTDPAFGMPYRDVLDRAQRERILWIQKRMDTQTREKFLTIWRQSVMGLRLPGDRFDALITKKIQALRSHLPVDHEMGLSMMPWVTFCRDMLFTSAQESAVLATLSTLHHEDDIPHAIEAEARARAEIAALLSPAQKRRWSAFAHRSLFTIQIAA